VADFCSIPQCGGMVFKPIKFTLFFLLFLCYNARKHREVFR
jgi:hypothetical protein